MKVRLLAVLAIICLFATIASAQTGFAGKWATDPPAAAPDGGAAAGGGGGRGGRGGGGGGVQLDLKVEGTKLTGTLSEGGVAGDPLTINEGAITGKQATWKTTRSFNGNDINVTWTADLSADDGTITLNRVIQGGFGGGGGRGGRGGGGGGAAAGAPPAGGAAPAAPAAPAAGAAPPAGGAPAAGGGQGRGGRGGGGGGLTNTLHRVK